MRRYYVLTVIVVRDTNGSFADLVILVLVVLSLVDLTLRDSWFGDSYARGAIDHPS
ncbi:hypothetical protein A2U01_0089576, partial [Trifolium medium]|nr:hypothetical protein [Trifolium medium]